MKASRVNSLGYKLIVTLRAHTRCLRSRDYCLRRFIIKYWIGSVPARNPTII